MSAAMKESSMPIDAVRGTLSAVVFHEVLKPLAAALGPAGEVVMERVIDGVFVKPPR